MADDFSTIDVKRLFESPPLRNNESVDPDREERRRRHGRPREKPPRGHRETKDYFHAIAKAAERSNEVLTARGSPFRFCIYRKGEDVFIEMVTRGRDGTIIDSKKRKITHQDFDRWIEDVAQMEGLFLDTEA